MTRTRLKTLLVAELTSLLERGGHGIVRLPAGGELLWQWFLALSRTRDASRPIAFGEIEAYGRVMRWPIEPWHAEILRALDDAFLAFGRKDTPAASSARGARAPLSPAAFDAVFA